MDLKKFASEAGTLFNRAKQFTEEKLGQAERTELDAHFENLLQRADKTREWTERIIGQTETVLQPNPNVRVEQFLYKKIEKKERDRLTDTETLGQYMIDAGNEFGPGTSYGSTLVKAGQTEQKLGASERDFVHSTANSFLQPLKAFLDGDMKTLAKERKALEVKRLDLDSAKGRLRRAKSASGRDQAEADLRKAQAEFDRQAEITKLLLEGISSTHAHHLRCLHDFIEAQSTYYAQCQQYMADLQRQLGSSASFGSAPRRPVGGSTSPDIHAPVYSAQPSNNTSYPPNNTSYPPNNTSYPPNNSVYPSAPASSHLDGVGDSTTSRAKALYDYDGADMTELSLRADEVIMVSPVPGQSDWLVGYRGSQRGRIPANYVQTLN